MRMQELESPQLIGPLNSEEVSDSIAFCTAHVNEARKIEQVSDDVALYELVQPSGGYFFLYDRDAVKKDRILYFVRYRKIDFSAKVLPSSGIRQVLLWRNSNSGATIGFAQKVFWDHLLPKFDVLVSDSQQTEQGKRFWMTVIKVALTEKNLKIRLIDTNDNTYDDFSTYEEMLKAEKRIWGEKPWFQRKIVAIIKE